MSGRITYIRPMQMHPTGSELGASAVNKPAAMNSLHRMVSRQFNDLSQKRQSTQLKSTHYSDEFSSSEEPVFQSIKLQKPEDYVDSGTINDSRPIKKLTKKLKKTFRRIEQPASCKKVPICTSLDICSDGDNTECTLRNKTMLEKIRDVKDSVSSSQIPNDLMKLYKHAKIIDVRNAKLSRRVSTNDNQNLLLFEELDNSH